MHTLNAGIYQIHHDMMKDSEDLYIDLDRVLSIAGPKLMYADGERGVEITIRFQLALVPSVLFIPAESGESDEALKSRVISTIYSPLLNACCERKTALLAADGYNVELKAKDLTLSENTELNSSYDESMDISLEEAIARGYAIISRKYRIASRLDRVDWKKALAKTHPAGMQWVKTLGNRQAADHYRRCSSKDQITVPASWIGKLPNSHSAPEEYRL